MQFKAVLWDMDGSLINSEPLYETSMHQVNQKYQLHYKHPYETLGVSFRDYWATIPDDHKKGINYNEWVADINAYVNEQFHTIEIFDSAHHVLTSVHSSQILQSCVSNNSKHFIEKILKHNKVDHMFHHWVGHEDVAHCKPHPMPYQYSAQLLQVNPSDCLAIEDSAVGVASAKAAGMKAALYCPPGVKPITQEADYIVSCHKELLKLMAAGK